MREPADIDIINNAIAGEEDAYYYIVNKYRDSVLLYLSNIISSKEDCEDICQEAFQKCFNNIHSYNPQYAFSTWIFTIAHNTALDFLRKKRVSTTPLEEIAQDKPTNDRDYSTLSPEESLINNQTIESIVTAIQNLPEHYKKVAELRFINELALEEISKKLEIPLNTVKTRVSRARKILNEIWKR